MKKGPCGPLSSCLERPPELSQVVDAEFLAQDGKLVNDAENGTRVAEVRGTHGHGMGADQQKFQHVPR